MFARITLFALVLSVSASAQAQDLISQSFGYSSGGGSNWSYSKFKYVGDFATAQCVDSENIGDLEVSATFDEFTVTVEAGQLEDLGGGWYQYREDSNGVDWYLVVTPSLQVWVRVTDTAGGQLDVEDGVEVSITLGDETGADTVFPTTEQSGNTGWQYYTEPTVWFDCFGVSQARVKEATGTNWALTHVFLKGRFSAAGCNGIGYLPFLDVDLTIDGTTYTAAAGSWTSHGNNYYTSEFADDEEGLSWSLTMNPVTGLFWIYLWDNEIGVVDATDGLDVDLSVGGQQGTTAVDVSVDESNSWYDAAYAYFSESGDVCR